MFIAFLLIFFDGKEEEARLIFICISGQKMLA
jgi:hypothetical protein